MRYARLSYDTGPSMPLYPGTQQVIIKPGKEILKGDSCNTLVVTFSNHTGTHIDAPKHFWDSGRSICDYQIEDFIFKKPLLIDCTKSIDEMIIADDLSHHINRSDPDLLLIRTGFNKYRAERPVDYNSEAPGYIYCNKNPYLSAEAAVWLREQHKSIKAIGVDCISIASHAHREIGRETHRILLKESDSVGQPILIIEDMNLSGDLKHLHEVIIAPLFIENADSTPCTVIGLIND